ncbi:MAG: MBL fold metallo-hydrolase [Bacteroidetes bacterium]|jgi:hydroxyacylglutathione hydrolase|nr:MBL fold metallo-hydrolase [Bacteroidota bacterium]
MLRIHSFTFNPFQENTYLIIDENNKTIIIDPGMYSPDEFDVFFNFIDQHKLIPELLLNTHTHLDHVFGNAAVLKKFDIPYGFHLADKPVFDAASSAGAMYGMSFEKSPEPTYYLKEHENVQLGNHFLKILLTPGHSPGSVCFYHEAQQFVISGDVLFQMSIGRSDFPGGNYDTLMQSIHSQLMMLPGDTKVYSGHGPETSIGFEKMNNPFITQR